MRILILPILLLFSGCEILGSSGDTTKAINIRAGASAGDASCYIEGVNARSGTDRYAEAKGKK